jgi:hypothetical protein
MLAVCPSRHLESGLAPPLPWLRLQEGRRIPGQRFAAEHAKIGARLDAVQVVMLFTPGSNKKADEPTRTHPPFE